MSNAVLGPADVETIVKEVNRYFAEISKIPRGSGNEEEIANRIEKFAKDLIDNGYDVSCKRVKDKVVGKKKIHDIVIRKEATDGYENVAPVILQAHIDMVLQPGDADFSQGVEFYYPDSENQMRGRSFANKNDTTLGADDGIGVACIMAILASKEIGHPAIEALFTSDEEDEMTGAMIVSKELVSAPRLINIDTELEGTFYYGCAGGINANFNIPIQMVPIPGNLQFYKIEVSGLKGGHSGVQIHEGHANASKLLARALSGLTQTLAGKDAKMYLTEIVGGDKKNAITQKATAIVGIKKEHGETLFSEAKKWHEVFWNEYQASEDRDEFKVAATAIDETYAEALSEAVAQKVISAVLLMPNDVQAMYIGEDNLVETSCNLGVLRQNDTSITMCSFIRSFKESKKQYVVEQMRTLAEFIGAGFSTDADFPNWDPKKFTDSGLQQRFMSAYKDVFHTAPEFASIHAGLECGHFARAFPDMDMIACGPTITGAHTQEETLYVDTIGKIVKLLLTVLQQMNTEVPVEEMDGAPFGKPVHNGHTHVCQCVI